jgi:hypothetical protein
MTTAIMQPTYLPWAGYFNLIARVDTFVFLNDVQFAKPSWQMRNRLLLQGAVHFITVPTQGSRNQRISEVVLAGDDFRAKHGKQLEHAYRKHAHGPALLELVLPILDDRSLLRLEQLNIALIRAFAKRLGLAPRFVCASELMPQGERSERLLALLQLLHERDYLSPAGSADYIAEDAVLEQAGVRVEYQRFVPAPYPQRGAAQFEPALSIVDVVANLGFDGARDYVRQAPAPSARLEPGAPARPPETRAPEPRAS